MKRLCSILLVLSVSLSLLLPSSAAENIALSTVKTLGILVGDENGELNLSGSVTRAQFAKMAVMASNRRDSVGAAANSSPFPDVPYTHWAASYVKTAVTNQWMTGYLDGTFRPDNTITYEEAVSTVLKLLGYGAEDYTGSYPSAQLALASSLGLDVGVTASRGSVMTRNDCVTLFYNVLRAKPKSGNSSYLASLGFQTAANGDIDLTALVSETLTGPVVLEQSLTASSLWSTLKGSVCYRNGALSSAENIVAGDVIYYSPYLKTVWAYHVRVSGIVEKVSPASSPTAVTIGGKSYSIESSEASFALSEFGSYHAGDAVTLLLGMDGTVVGIQDISSAASTVIGVVTETAVTNYTDSLGNSYQQKVVRLTATDGNSYEYPYTSGSFTAGGLVKVVAGEGSSQVSTLSGRTLSGKVNASELTIGSYELAQDIRILETDGSTCGVTYLSRLDGVTLSQSQVLSYETNAQGEITDLILGDVTGDLHTYGIVLSVSEQDREDGGFQCSYSFNIGGETQSYSTSTYKFNASTGPAKIVRDGNTITSIKSLKSVRAAALTSSTLTAEDGTQYPLSDTAVVYLEKSGSGYLLTSLPLISDLEAYRVYGYYDTLPSQGGRIRILIAVESQS